ATAEAELGDLPAAQLALNKAEAIFAALHAEGWVATARLRRAKVALRRGYADDARAEVDAALASFSSMGYRVLYAHALLLRAEAVLADGETGQAQEAATRATHRPAASSPHPALRHASAPGPHGAAVW